MTFVKSAWTNSSLSASDSSLPSTPTASNAGTNLLPILSRHLARMLSSTSTPQLLLAAQSGFETAAKLSRPSPHPRSAWTSADLTSAISSTRFMTTSGHGTQGDRDASWRYSWASSRFPPESLGAKPLSSADGAPSEAEMDPSPGSDTSSSELLPPRCLRRLRGGGAAPVDEDERLARRDTGPGLACGPCGPWLPISIDERGPCHVLLPMKGALPSLGSLHRPLAVALNVMVGRR